jgi:hypothetical protein
MEPTGNVKTLGVKLPDELHAQFSLVAALDQISLNEAVLRAVTDYVAAKQQAPDFAGRAKTVLDEIEREAAAKRGAIEALFGQASPTADKAKAAAKKAGSDTSA